MVGGAWTYVLLCSPSVLAAVGVYDRLRSAATEQQKDRAAVAGESRRRG